METSPYACPSWMPTPRTPEIHPKDWDYLREPRVGNKFAPRKVPKTPADARAPGMADDDGNVEFPELSDEGNVGFPELADEGNVEFSELSNIDVQKLSMRVVGLGCIPDIPDHRDRAVDREFIEAVRNHGKTFRGGRRGQRELQYLERSKANLPGCIRLHDEKAVFSFPQDQGPLNSCTAHATVALAEYMMLAGGGPQRGDLSRMFLYKAARTLDGRRGNTGASIRSAMIALRQLGTPSEAMWPYSRSLLDTVPPQSVCQAAKAARSAGYFRLDSGDATGDETLTVMKRCLADGFPFVAGLTVFDSIKEISNDAIIPAPRDSDARMGSHAILVVGYTDIIPKVGAAKGGDSKNKQKQAEGGCFIVRNSWGPSWGHWGHAYLPYEYVLRQLLVDCWTILDGRGLPPAPTDV